MNAKYCKISEKYHDLDFTKLKMMIKNHVMRKIKCNDENSTEKITVYTDNYYCPSAKCHPRNLNYIIANFN